MMRKLGTIFLVLVLSTTSSAQMPPDTLWTKIFGADFMDTGSSVQQTSDGGFIVTGYTRSFGAGESDVWLIRTDGSGDTLWTRTYGGTDQDTGKSVQQTSDGGFIVTGSTGRYPDYDVLLMKTDASGETLWRKTYGGDYGDKGFSVQQISDGGFIITGYANQWGAGGPDLLLIRTNGKGDTLWTRTYGGNNADIGKSVQQTSDGGFIVTGTTSPNLWLIKTDA